MFEDDRGRLLQIGAWLARIEEGVSSPSAMADEVLGWRLSMIQQACAGLSSSLLNRHPEIMRLGLPTLDEVLSDLKIPLEQLRAVAQRTAQVFAPLLASLPPPPVQRPRQPKVASQHERIVRDLKGLEPVLRAKGIATLYLFGSVARSEDKPESDVDIAFVIDSHRSDGFSLFDQANVQITLADALGRAVDLITLDQLRPEMKNRVEVDLLRIF